MCATMKMSFFTNKWLLLSPLGIAIMIIGFLVHDSNFDKGSVIALFGWVILSIGILSNFKPVYRHYIGIKSFRELVARTFQKDSASRKHKKD